RASQGTAARSAADAGRSRARRVQDHPPGQPRSMESECPPERGRCDSACPGRMSDPVAPTDAATTISLAYSVDADDAFMFHALRTGAIDTGKFQFVHRRAHTAALNQLAVDGGADVVAVSVGVYPAIAARYQMLPHGASVGRGFGPVVVAPRALAPRDLAGLRAGIPGATTTAWLVLLLIAPEAIGVEIPLSPLGAIF